MALSSNFLMVDSGINQFERFLHQSFLYFVNLNLKVMSKPQDSAEAKINMEMLSFNMRKIDSVLTVLFIVSGILAGVLGLTSLNGLLFYILMSVVSTVALLARMKFDASNYTVMKTVSLLIHGMSSQAMSFVLFWTLAYALVHIY